MITFIIYVILILLDPMLFPLRIITESRYFKMANSFVITSSLSTLGTSTISQSPTQTTTRKLARKLTPTLALTQTLILAQRSQKPNHITF